MSLNRMLPLAALLLMASCEKQPEGVEDRYDDEGNLAGDDNRITVVVQDDPPTTMYAPRFPLPGFPGEEVAFESHDNKPGEQERMHRTIYAPKPAAEVAAFFQQAMNDKGLAVQRSDSRTTDYEQVQLYGASDAATATVLIDQKIGEKKSSVIITWSPKQ